MTKYIVFLFTIILLYTQNKTIIVYITPKKKYSHNLNKALIKDIISLYNLNHDNKIDIEFKLLSNFSEAFKRLKNNISDTVLAINNISINALRKEEFDFSSSYLPVMASLIVNEMSSITEENWRSELKSLSVFKASIYGNIALQFSKRNNIKLNYKDDYNFENAFIGDCLDAWLDPTIRIVHYLENETVSEFAIMYPKNSNLKKLLDPTVKYFTTSNIYYHLINEYLNKDVNFYFQKVRSKF